MLRIIDRYLIREILLTFLAVILILFLVVLSNRMAGYLADAAAGNLPGDVIFTLLALKSVSVLPLIVPVAIFLAIMLTFGRLYKDSEMAALTACGAGPGTFYRPLMMIALPMTALMYWVTLYIAPQAAESTYRIRAEAQQSAELLALAAGRFRESKHGDRIFFIERVSDDKQKFENIFIQTRQRGRIQLQTAAHAHQSFDDSGARVIVLKNGHLYDGLPGAGDFNVIHFGEQRLRITPETSTQVNLKKDALATSDLWGSDAPYQRAELHWRLAVPLTALMLTLLALPLSHSTPREGRYGRLLAGILVYIIYTNLLSVAQVWLEWRLVPEFLGIWWVHLLVLMLTAILLVRGGGYPVRSGKQAAA